MQRLVIVLGIVLAPLAAAAEQPQQPPCTCNDDCQSKWPYSGLCVQYSYGRFCGWSGSGVPCTDGGPPAPPDMIGQVHNEAGPLKPDTIPRPDQQRSFADDPVPPSDLRVHRADGGPSSAAPAPRHGCAIALGEAPATGGLLFLVAGVALLGIVRRRAARS